MKLSNFLKGLDAYGEKVSLLYEQQNTHKTVLGGIVTVIAQAAMIAYIAF